MAVTHRPRQTADDDQISALLGDRQHLFGGGLADDRYVVERFKAHADGDIRPWPGEAPAKKRRKAKRVTATLTEVRELRPARTEIIVCTGLRTRCGMQIWGATATSLFCDRRQRG